MNKHLFYKSWGNETREKRYTLVPEYLYTCTAVNITTMEPEFKPLKADENVLRWYVQEKEYRAAYHFMQGFVAPFNFSAKMQEDRVHELRKLLDKDTLCTIISAEKTVLQQRFEPCKKHIAEIDSYLEKANKVTEFNYNFNEISCAKWTYGRAASYWHKQKNDSFKELNNLEILLEKLAKSSVSDRNYPETRDYLKMAEETYQVLVNNTSSRAEEDLPRKKEHLNQLHEAVAALTEYIKTEESVFPLSRETYQAAAEGMDCYASERAYELGCAAVAPTANEMGRLKSERLDRLNEKIRLLFPEKAMKK